MLASLLSPQIRVEFVDERRRKPKRRRLLFKAAFLAAGGTSICRSPAERRRQRIPPLGRGQNELAA
jgi:hypothetical protein